jgi:hypothetical protein
MLFSGYSPIDKAGGTIGVIAHPALGFELIK